MLEKSDLVERKEREKAGGGALASPQWDFLMDDS